MNKRNLIIVSIIIVLVTGAVMIFKSDSQESATSSVTSEIHSEVEQPVPSEKSDEIVAAPKDEEDAPMDIESLPTLDDMKELSEEEVHHTPEVITESARELGKMIDAAEKNPELRERTVKFLLQCAESENVVASIRAVCWKNTLNGMNNWKVFVPVSEAKVPQKIQDLANQLP